DAVAPGDLLRTHVIPHDPANDKELAGAGIPHLAFYLIRPDGYIGLCGGRMEAQDVTRYLTERVRRKPALRSFSSGRPAWWAPACSASVSRMIASNPSWWWVATARA